MANAGEPPEAPQGGGGDVTDSSLLRRLQKGNEDAATQLYLRYAERLRLLARAECSPELARRVEVDDIVQSVFASFFRGVGRGFYDVPAGAELWRLLLVIALNKIRAKGAFHRAAKRDVRLTVGEDFIDHAGKAERETDHTPIALLRLVIDEALGQLPPVQKQMILFRIEGFEVAEIAEKTQRSKRTVERVLQDFRKKLAGLLQEQN